MLSGLCCPQLYKVFSLHESARMSEALRDEASERCHTLFVSLSRSSEAHQRGTIATRLHVMRVCGNVLYRNHHLYLYEGEQKRSKLEHFCHATAELNRVHFIVMRNSRLCPSRTHHHDYRVALRDINMRRPDDQDVAVNVVCPERT